MIKQTVTNIGLLDYDTIINRLYTAPNYDLGVTYAYLRQDKNLNVRLVTSLFANNLKQYDKIYIFRQSHFLSPPAATIANYNYYSMEEYGPGFFDKPLRPFQEETRFLQPDFTCYNNMLKFSMDRPKYPTSWRIDKWAKGPTYKPIRLYEMFNGEELKKDYPIERYNIIYDDPTDIILNPDKLEYYLSFARKGHTFIFAQSFDVGRVNDTNILERVMTERVFAPFRKRMIASELGDGFQWLVKGALDNTFTKGISIKVKLPVAKGTQACMRTLLLMNYYNRKARRYTLHLAPMWDKKFLAADKLALLAYNYVVANPGKMSFYKYAIFVGYIQMGIPMKTIKRTNYDYLLEHYGIPDTVRLLEEWLESHPDFTEHVFIGGNNYEEQRQRYDDFGGSKIAFRASTDYIGEERSS